MKFIAVTDIDGRLHLVNPTHIAAIEDADAGCVIHVRGRRLNPIVLQETTEVMRDVLEVTAQEEKKSRDHRGFHFGHG